jgi:hypothetical protein
VVLGFELGIWHLLGRCSNTGAMPPALFALVILGIGSHIFVWASLDHNTTYTSHVAEMTGVHLHAWLVVEMSAKELFCLD